MMIQIVIIGIGAGAAAALLFASVTSGSWLSIPLFYLAPLPIMIAGLGWSHWAAMTAALAGALGLGAAFGVSQELPGRGRRVPCGESTGVGVGVLDVPPPHPADV